MGQPTEGSNPSLSARADELEATSKATLRCACRLKFAPQVAPRIDRLAGAAPRGTVTGFRGAHVLLLVPGDAFDDSASGGAGFDVAGFARVNAAPDEFGSAAVMTVYDGTGVADVAFIGPTYADSPRLGDIVPRALDCAYGRGHNELRLTEEIVEAYRAFIEAAETGVATSCGGD